MMDLNGSLIRRRGAESGGAHHLGQGRRQVRDTITLGGRSGTDDVTVTVQTANGPVTVTLHETAM